MGLGFHRSDEILQMREAADGVEDIDRESLEQHRFVLRVSGPHGEGDVVLFDAGTLEQRLHEVVDMERRVLRHPMQGSAAQEMAHRPDHQQTTQQREIAARVEERFEQALEARAARSRGWRGRLRHFGNHLTGDRDSLLDRQELAFLSVENHAVHELGQGGCPAHGRCTFVHAPAPAEISDAIEARIDIPAADLLHWRAALEHVELGAGLLALEQHRHEAVLPLERASRRLDGERKAELAQCALQHRLARQLAAKQDVDFHGHGAYSDKRAKPGTVILRRSTHSSCVERLRVTDARGPTMLVPPPATPAPPRIPR